MLQKPGSAAASVLLLVLAAEKLHERRCRSVARLAAGPSGAPRRWVRGAPMVKAVALAATA